MMQPTPHSSEGVCSSMLRSTSVVMTMIEPSRFSMMSPVSRPTASPYCSRRSRNFWLRQRLDRRGVHHRASPVRAARKTPNSATTVLPVPVGAATITDSFVRQVGDGLLLEGVERERIAGAERGDQLRGIVGVEVFGDGA